jgi:hypothetical protein
VAFPGATHRAGSAIRSDLPASADAPVLTKMLFVISATAAPDHDE